MKTKLLKYSEHLAKAINIGAHVARTTQTDLVLSAIIKALYDLNNPEVSALVDQHVAAETVD